MIAAPRTSEPLPPHTVLTDNRVGPTMNELPARDEELPPLPHVQPLNDADRDLFLAVLDNPPAPNAALRKLMSGGTH